MFFPRGGTHSGVTSKGGTGLTKERKISLWAHLAESDHTEKQKDLLSSGRVAGECSPLVKSITRTWPQQVLLLSFTNQAFAMRKCDSPLMGESLRYAK